MMDTLTNGEGVSRYHSLWYENAMFEFLSWYPNSLRSFTKIISSSLLNNEFEIRNEQIIAVQDYYK